MDSEVLPNLGWCGFLGALVVFPASLGPMTCWFPEAEIQCQPRVAALGSSLIIIFTSTDTHDMEPQECRGCLSQQSQEGAGRRPWLNSITAGHLEASGTTIRARSTPVVPLPAQRAQCGLANGTVGLLGKGHSHPSCVFVYD